MADIAHTVHVALGERAYDILIGPRLLDDAGSLLAERFDNSGFIRGSWPKDDLPLSRSERIELQNLLSANNYDAGNPDGFEVELSAELCKRAALECEIVINEWDSMIPNLVAGNYDAIMAGMSITDERKQQIDFSDDYFPPDPSAYMVRAGTTLDFEALNGVNIGVQGATIQAAYAEQNFGAANTIKAFETADQALADRPVQGVIAEVEAVDLMEGADDLVGDGVALGEEPVAGGVVHPPLDHQARAVVGVEYIVGPLGVTAGGRVGHLLEFAAVGKFADIARAVQGAGHDLHCVFLSDWLPWRPFR